MKGMHMVAFLLLAVGGLNWGLVGLGNWMGSNWNLVNLLFGSWPMVENLVYVLVGVSAVVIAVGHKKDCRQCSAMGGAM
jgi:uncharacterized membrane protein YuzA (DUF378 family)